MATFCFIINLGVTLDVKMQCIRVQCLRNCKNIVLKWENLPRFAAVYFVFRRFVFTKIRLT